MHNQRGTAGACFLIQALARFTREEVAVANQTDRGYRLATWELPKEARGDNLQLLTALQATVKAKRVAWTGGEHQLSAGLRSSQGQ